MMDFLIVGIFVVSIVAIGMLIKWCDHEISK